MSCDCNCCTLRSITLSILCEKFIYVVQSLQTVYICFRQVEPFILECAISMAIKYESSRKCQLPSLQENLNIMKTVNFTKTFTYKIMLGIPVPTENTRHCTWSAGEQLRPKRRDKNSKNIIRSPWHLWNSPETTGTSSNKGVSKKNRGLFSRMCQNQSRR